MGEISHIKRNSRFKVQKLIDLKLIQNKIDLSQFDEKELEKGAKYYKVVRRKGISGMILYFNCVLLSIHYVQLSV